MIYFEMFRQCFSYDDLAGYTFSMTHTQMVRSESMSREICLDSFSSDFRTPLQENQFYPWRRPHKLIKTTWFRVFNLKCSWLPWTFVMAQVNDTQQCLGNSKCLWPEQMELSLILMQFGQK